MTDTPDRVPIKSIGRLQQLKIEEGIMDHGFLGYIAQYTDNIFDGSDVDDKILLVQDLITDIEIEFKRLGIKLNPVKDYDDERRP